MSVVLSRRDMPTQIVEVPHTVTEMGKITHSFDNGWVAKRGIDY